MVTNAPSKLESFYLLILGLTLILLSFRAKLSKKFILKAQTYFIAMFLNMRLNKINYSEKCLLKL